MDTKGINSGAGKSIPRMYSVFELTDVLYFCLKAFLGGNEGGNAIADVIFGKMNPSGKLPMTFPKVLEDCPSHANFGQAMTTVYAEGLKVGYRYFDRPGNPSSQFAFGCVLFLPGELQT